MWQRLQPWAFSALLSVGVATLPPPWESHLRTEAASGDRRPADDSQAEGRYEAGVAIPYLTPEAGIRWAPMVEAPDPLRLLRCRDAKTLDAWLCR